MTRILMGISILTVLMTVSRAYAGKVEDVQAAIKTACNRDVPNDEALRLIKNLYYSCESGKKVDIGGCQVNCLRAAENIFGR